jgi:hypothetical protein
MKTSIILVGVVAILPATIVTTNNKVFAVSFGRQDSNDPLGTSAWNVVVKK